MVEKGVSTRSTRRSEKDGVSGGSRRGDGDQKTMHGGCGWNANFGMNDEKEQKKCKRKKGDKIHGKICQLN